MILCEFLDEVFGRERLLPADPYLKAQEKLTIDEFNKTISLFYKTLMNQDENNESRLMEKFSKSLSNFEIKLKDSDFLGG